MQKSGIWDLGIRAHFALMSHSCHASMSGDLRSNRDCGTHSYVTLGKFFNFSETRLPYIKIGIIMTQSQVTRRVKICICRGVLAANDGNRL